MNKVVETRASRETTPPQPNGQAKDENGVSKPDNAANETAAEATPARDPLEEIQEQVHPFK